MTETVDKKKVNLIETKNNSASFEPRISPGQSGKVFNDAIRSEEECVESCTDQNDERNDFGVSWKKINLTSFNRLLALSVISHFSGLDIYSDAKVQMTSPGVHHHQKPRVKTPPPPDTNICNEASASCQMIFYTEKGERIHVQVFFFSQANHVLGVSRSWV